jgi:hypothetical protein
VPGRRHSMHYGMGTPPAPVFVLVNTLQWLP